MKIRYKKKNLKINLILGLLWLIFAITQMSIFNHEEESWIKYGWLVLSLSYIGIYSYKYFNQYLTVKNGFILENSPFGTKIRLTEIKQIKKYAGEYILKTDDKELTINTQLIEPKSLTALNVELNTLNVEWK